MKHYEETAERVLKRRDAYAARMKQRKKTALRILPAAMSLCLCAAVVLTVLLFPTGTPPTVDRPSGTDADGRTLWSDTRVYNDQKATTAERAYVFPWAYKTTEERYRSLTFGGTEYSTRGTEIGADLLGDRLGTSVSTGYDEYKELPHVTACTVYGITGIPDRLLVAVQFPESDAYYVFKSEDAETAPATLGDLIDAYALTETLPLTEFSLYDPKDAASDSPSPRYALTDADGAALYALLASSRTAPADTDYDTVAYTERITFTASSETLGIENRVFTVTVDGYLWTNLADYGYAYFIGTDAAAEIIDYARAHGTEKEPDTTYYLTGTVTETGEGYLKLDDSIMMKNAKDGVVFTVYLRDFRVSRYVDSGYLKVGDTVRIEFDGKIYDGDPLTVETVYAIVEAIVSQDGSVGFPK